MITVTPRKSPYFAKPKPVLDSAAELVKLVNEIRQMHEKAVAYAEDAKKLADSKLKELNGLQERILLIQKGEKGERGENGKDGHPGLVGKPGKKGEAGPAGKDGKDGTDGKDGMNPDPEDVVDLIKEKKLLKTEHIDGLKEEIASYRNQLATRGGMRGGQGSWNVANLTGAINGSNKLFTASAGNPPATNSHHVMLNYQEQNPITDYTVSFANGTITVKYTTAPDASLSGLPHYIRWL